jgi:P27 family predicted phage terminase small subunit
VTRPRWLSNPRLSGEALAIWRRLAPKLLQAEALTSANAYRLEAACRLLAAADAAGRALEQDGAILGKEKGAQRANPGFYVMVQAQREAKKLLDELTPSWGVD